MNPAKSLFEQQMGRYVWKEYDNSLTRLRCASNDEFQRIVPTELDVDQNVDTPIFACKFAQNKGYEHILALANEDGYLAIHDTFDKEPRHGNQIHHNAIFDLAWLCNEMKLITVSGDHTARLVDINRNHLCATQIFSGHTRSVKTVASRSDDASTFATGSRDGSILVWDTRSNMSNDIISTPDRHIAFSHQVRPFTSLICSTTRRRVLAGMSGANSVTGLAFQDENTLISCSAGDGKIKFWDLRKTYKLTKKGPTPKFAIDYAGSTTRNGFSNLLLDDDGIRLYANCLDNTIYCYNIANYNPNPVMRYTGHQNSTFYVKSSLSHDGKYILCGSSDQKAYIWNIKNPEPIVRLNGHTAEVTCVAWRPTAETLLVTCSDDVRHKIWRIGSELLPDNWEYAGRGEAEPLKIIQKSTKRTYTCSRIASPNKKLKKCDNCLYIFDKFCENCNYRTGSSRKRLLPPESSESLSKSSQRCLFKPLLNEENVIETFKNGEISTSDFKRKRSLGDDALDIERLKNMRLESEPSEDKDGFNPVANFPNFVIDGCAPHLQMSPQKKPDKDWLTKMRIQKNLMSRYSSILAENDVNHCDSVDNQPKVNKTPKSSRKKSACSSPQSPILRFFKVTSSSNVKDNK